MILRLRFFFLTAVAVMVLCFSVRAGDIKILEATVAEVGDRIIFLSDIRGWIAIKGIETGNNSICKNLTYKEIDKNIKEYVDTIVILSYLERIGLFKDNKKNSDDLEFDFIEKAGGDKRYRSLLESCRVGAEVIKRELWERLCSGSFAEKKRRSLGDKAFRSWLEEEKKKVGVKWLPWKLIPKGKSQE